MDHNANSSTFQPSLPSRWLPLSVRIWIFQQLAFHLIALVFEWCDRTGAICRFKVRSLERKPYTKMLSRVLFNQAFVLLPSMVIMQVFRLSYVGETRLTMGRFLISLPVMALGHDIVQYVTHRFLLHQSNSFLMRTLRHSIHHSTGANSGITACYMSAPDFFLEIVLPYLIPLAVIGGGGSDILFHALTVSLGAFGGVYEHSGYDFAVHLRNPPPGGNHTTLRASLSKVLAYFLDNRAHSAHHTRANVSFSDGFGSPGFSDTVLGTRWDLVPKHRPGAE